MLAALCGAGIAGIAGCRSRPGDGTPPTPRRTLPTPSPTPSPPRPTLAPAPTYVPVAGEVFPRAKTAAARFLQTLLTYDVDEPRGSSVARSLPLAVPTLDAAVLAARARSLLLGEAQSTAEVVYPQLGGLVPLGSGASYAVVMAVVRHRLLTADGEKRETTRTMDVRLRVVDGEWRVEELASVGGDPAPRPRTVPAAARRILDDPRITLPDSARWDLHRGEVDGRLLDVMSALAARAPYSVTVLRTGHPEKVVDGFADRVSNHFRGRAVDVWSLGERPLVQQRARRDTVAFQLLEQVVAPGPADEVGVPVGWDLDGGVRQIFANVVHDDHFHLGFRRAAG